MIVSHGLGWFWCYGSYGTRFCLHTYNRTYKSNWSCCHRNHGIQYWKSVLYCSAHHDADTHHSIVLISNTGAQVDISERARRAAMMSAVTQPQGNKTQPPGRKNVTLEKSSWRAPGQWYGAGEGNFPLGCVLSPGCIFVCVFIIQILYVVLPYKWA